MKTLLTDFLQTIKTADKFVVVFSLVMVTRSLGFLYLPDYYGYIFLLVMSAYSLYMVSEVSNQILLLITYLAFNILVTNPNEIFKPWMRLGLFVLLLLSVGPFLQSEKLRKKRRQVFDVIIWLSSFFSVLSFFCYFLGINYMYVSPDISIYNSAGTFGGLFNQSMMMGPIAGLSAIFLSYKYYQKRNRWYLYCALCCFGAVFLSSSRSSLMATFSGTLVMIYKASGGKTKFIKIATAVVLIASISFPIWGGLTNGLQIKQSNNLEDGGSAFASREDKWDARLAEFKSSPVFGIGYASVDSKLDDVGSDGTIEPGTSWLAVLSMAGILGFLIFVKLFFTCYKACNRMLENKDAMLLGFLALFAVHMFAEGYVFAAGGFLCFILWLVVGVCYDRKYSK